MPVCGNRATFSGPVLQPLLRATGLSTFSTNLGVIQQQERRPTFSQGYSSAMASFADDNRRELAAAAIFALVGIAALYPAWNLMNSSEPPYMETTKNVLLNPRQWVNFTLQESQRVTHNTRIFRFAIDSNMSLGFHAASYLLTRAELGSSKIGRPEIVIRSYSPISNPNAKGYFDLMIKVYSEGSMSRHIARLSPGDSLEVKGPIEQLQYQANMKKRLGMVAGGTGITPMLQVINAIMTNPKDNTQVSLIYANGSPEDILVKEKLDVLAQSHPNFKVYYTVDVATTEWRGGQGHVNMDMVIKGLPPPSDDTLILVCGPPKMMDLICGERASEHSQGEVLGVLKEIGYKDDQVYKF